MKHFRKLAHCNDSESYELQRLRVAMTVMSFILELAVKYNNQNQITIAQIELTRLKHEFEAILNGMFERTGLYPGVGKIEITRSGDVLEYHSH